MMRWGRGHSLRHSRLQIVLAIAAIGTSVALPVVLLSVGGGVSAHELANLQSAGYQVVVSAAGLHGITFAHNDTEKILSIGGVTSASPVLSIAIDAFNSSGAVSPVLAEGVIPDQFTPTLGPIDSSLFPSPLPLGDPTDTVHFDHGTYSGPSTNDVLVSTPYAAYAKVSVSQQISLGPVANSSLSTNYTVTGTFGVAPLSFGPTAAYVVLLPLSDLQNMTGYARGSSAPDAADTIDVAVTGAVAANPGALAQVRDEVQIDFHYYSVSLVTQQAQQLEAASGVLTGFYLALSSVGLTVGLMFLALVLLRRVEMDRRSIGIRRALGISGRSIAAEIVRDGAVLAASGAIVGLLGGYLIVESLAAWSTSAVQEAARLAVFDPVLLGEVVAAVVGLSLLVGAIATRTALRMEISEALR